MTTIYAVSRGSYSDYGIEALFSDKGKAEEYKAAFPAEDWNDIEKYELDPPLVRLMREGFQPWNITMRRDGTVEDVTRAEGRYALSWDESAFVWKRTEAPAYKDVPGVVDALRLIVLAKSEKAAIKIANERRAQMIADGQWK